MQWLVIPEVQPGDLHGRQHALPGERTGRAGSNPLSMGITAGHSELSRGYERPGGKYGLLDLRVVNSCAPSNLEKEIKRPASAVTVDVNGRNIVLGCVPRDLHPTSADCVDVQDPGFGYSSPRQGNGGQARRSPG